MGVFDNILKSEESLFKNSVALDFDYLPKIIPYRESEQRQIASCIKPLFDKRNGRNIVIFGLPGVGKTAATKKVLEELEEKSSDIIPIYINCWQRNTSYKILLGICDKINYRFTQNKKTDELFHVIRDILNKKSIVFVFDEIDKVEDFDFLYMILEDIYRKTIILVTNYKSWLLDLDQRIKSRLVPEIIEFKPYNLKETTGILKQRVEYAFNPNVFDTGILDIIAAKTFELKDIRAGLYLLKESGNIAEDASSRKITKEHVSKAIEKLSMFSIKSSGDIEDSDEKFILSVIKKFGKSKIGDLFKRYQDEGGSSSYKTFQRKISKLHKSGFISVKKIFGGAEGSTTIIKPSSVKKLTEF